MKIRGEMNRKGKKTLARKGIPKENHWGFQWNHKKKNTLTTKWNKKSWYMVSIVGGLPMPKNSSKGTFKRIVFKLMVVTREGVDFKWNTWKNYPQVIHYWNGGWNPKWDIPLTNNENYGKILCLDNPNQWRKLLWHHVCRDFRETWAKEVEVIIKQWIWPTSL